MMAFPGGENGINGDFHIAVGAVLEADGRRQSRSQLAMNLRFGRPGADGPPADKVANVLRRDGIEKLRPGRHPQFMNLHEQVTSNAQAFVDAESSIQIGVVDQPLPTDGGARLFEINPHHDFEIVCQPPANLRQSARIFNRRVRIVNGTRSDHDEQPIRAALQNLLQVLASSGD